MKRNVKNDKVLRAITIGLATMIAATSAPMTVLATEGEGGSENSGETTPTPTPCEETESIAKDAESKTETAEDSYVEAVESIVDDSKAEETQNSSDGGTQPASNDNNIFEGLEDYANTLLDQSGEVNTEYYDNAEINIQGEISETDGQVKIKGAVQHLEDADDADKDADDAAETATGKVAVAESLAETAESSVSSTVQEAAPFINVISDASSTQESVSNAYVELDKLVKKAEGEFSVLNDKFAQVKKDYNIAIGKLTAAEKRYQDSLDLAEDCTDEALQNLSNAKKKVDELGNKLANSKKQINQKAIEIATVKDKLNEAESADWNTQRDLMKKIVINYVLPEGAKLVSYEYSKGFNGQNSSRGIFVYELNGETITKYYNYDRDDREINENDQWNRDEKQNSRLGDSKNIIIYERTQEEVEADLYVSKYYNNTTDKDFKNKNGKKFKDRVNSGEFDVFVFVAEDGTKTYKVRDELVNNKDGLVTVSDNGTFVWNGLSGSKVEQSTKDSNAVNLKINADEDEGLNNLVNDDALKYAKYNREITAARNALKTATNRTNDLKNSIFDLRGKNRFVKYLPEETIGGILKEELSDYLTDEEIASIETVDQAIKVLNRLLEDAESRMKSASLQLDELKGLRDEVAKRLDDGLNDDSNITDDDGDDGSDDDDTAGDAGFAGPSGYVASSGFGATPIILPSTTSIFGGTGTTAGGEGSGVLGVRAENPADQISSSLDSKIVNKPVAKKMIANKTNKKGTKIEDPIVPLAETPFEDSTRLNWGWLLIIFLLGATGKKLYDEYKKKQEEANAAKSK